MNTQKQHQQPAPVPPTITLAAATTATEAHMRERERARYVKEFRITLLRIATDQTVAHVSVYVKCRRDSMVNKTHTHRTHIHSRNVIESSQLAIEKLID